MNIHRFSEPGCQNPCNAFTNSAVSFSAPESAFGNTCGNVYGTAPFTIPFYSPPHIPFSETGTTDEHACTPIFMPENALESAFQEHFCRCKYNLNAIESIYQFTMPQNATLRSIYVNFSASSPCPLAADILPYIAIATAPSNSSHFAVIPKSITPSPSPYCAGKVYPPHSMRNACSVNLNIPLHVGRQVAVVLGYLTSDEIPIQTFSFACNGGFMLR
jgi:hypothetical protein